MKIIIIIWFCIFSFSCTFHKKSDEFKTVEIEQLQKKVIDSLIECKTKKILVLRKGCSGCIKGFRETIYVFWMHNEISPKIRKFDSYSGIGGVLEIDDLTNYFFTFKDEIIKEKLNEPEYILSHYHYTGIKLLLNGKEYYKKEIPITYFSEFNEEKKLIIWIQKIESKIFNLERR